MPVQRLKRLRAALLASFIGACVIFLALFVLSPIGLTASRDEARDEERLNIYSYRQAFLIEELVGAYAGKTGVDVRIVFADKGLAQRLRAEGRAGVADLVLASDVSQLAELAANDVLSPIESSILASLIPSYLRDPQWRWVGLTKRARVIVAAKDNPVVIESYEQLADPMFRGRICTRPGSHVYNRALLASMIAAHGAEEAERWAQGLVANLARKPQGNDRAQAAGVAAGICGLAIMNSYYLGAMRHSDKPEQRAWARKIRLIFPNQKGRGTHVNISGAGVVKFAPNRAGAVRFIEWLASPQAQEIYASKLHEYPANGAAEISAEVRSWGTFKADSLPIGRIVDLSPTAQRIVNRTGW